MSDSQNEKANDPSIQGSQTSPPIPEKLPADTEGEKNAVTQPSSKAVTPDLSSVCESFEFSIPGRNLPAKFPMVFVLLVLSVAISVHGLAIQFWHLIGGSLVGDFLISILFGVIFLSLSYYLWVNRLHRHNLTLQRPLIAALAICGAMCIIGICHSISKLGHQDEATASADQPKSEKTDKGHHATAMHPEFNPLETVLMLLLGAFSFRYLFDAEHSLPERLLAQTQTSLNKSIGVQHLILPLTAPNFKVSIGNNGKLELSDYEQSSAGIKLPGVDIKEDVRKLDDIKPYCNWQQILRAIEPHLATLQSVWILGSNGKWDSEQIPNRRLSREEQSSGGSHAYSSFAARFIQPYLNSDAKIYCCRMKPDNNKSQLQFHDYFAVEQSILAIIERIKRDFSAAAENAIVIDTTGAQKLTSIVGAALTFRRQAIFQYVDTEPPNSVHVYEITLESKPETGL